jgi:hypothetical protein
MRFFYQFFIVISAYPYVMEFELDYFLCLHENLVLHQIYSEGVIINEILKLCEIIRVL